MRFDAKAIAAATSGHLVHDGVAGPIGTDSRRVAEGSWFVALSGDKFDGHDYLPHAAAAGCAGAVVARVPENWTRGLVVVGDTLVALQDLGRAARAQFHGPTVAITGSAGKTSTRVMIVDALAALGKVHHTQGNLNNHIGLPLTLVATPLDADVLVLELGMNHPGEIALLQEIASPSVRVITNVGAAHVEGCGSIDGVARAKQELFDGAREGDIVCVNVDDPFISAMPIPDGVRVITYGRSPHAMIRLTDVAVDGARLQTRLRLETPDGSCLATLNVPGAHLAINAAAAAAVAFALRVPLDTLGPALARFEPEGMRNRVERIAGTAVLDDAYNANPTSMLASLATLAALPGRTFAVLGDMLELGTAEEESHALVLDAAQRLGIDVVLVTGERMSRAAMGREQVRVFADVESLARALLDEFKIGDGDALLVKGSRGARMERVVERLRAARRA